MFMQLALDSASERMLISPQGLLRTSFTWRQARFVIAKPPPKARI
jgi:hypothetical protein